MSDADWRDPFEEDETARERARRRTEREARRRERSEAARRRLGERVREDSPAPPPPAAGRGQTEPDEAGATGFQPPAGSEPEQPGATGWEPPPVPPPPVEPAGAAHGPEPTPAERMRAGMERLRTSSAASADVIRRRRALGIVAVIALILALTGVFAVLSRGGGEEETPFTPVAKRKTISITIPEGLTRKQMADVVDSEPLKGSYAAATKSVKGFDLARYDAKDADSLEGFLFPATYEVFKGAKVDSLVRKQLEAFEQNFSQLNLRYAKSKNLDAYDVVIIASMIEKEISIPEERRLAASVIYNRLAAGGPLGIDATIRYVTGNYDKPLLESELAIDSPYNSRIYSGLPPGPIANPGLASLEAAANPAKTDYFYYVVKPCGEGEHEFVETAEEFAAAEQRYNSAREAAGGKSPDDC